MAGFVQIIEYRTSKPEEIATLMEDFQKNREAAGDGPSPTRAMTCADRDEAGRYYSIVEFSSYEEAMENSGRADTTEFAETMMGLCDGPTRFYNLDVAQTAEYS
jgi:hypothetical protein